MRGEVKKMVAERRRDVKADWSFSCSLSVFVDDFDSATLTDDEDENALSLRRAFVDLKTRRILFVEVCLFTCIGRREEVGTKADDDDNAGNIFFSYIKVLACVVVSSCEAKKHISSMKEALREIY
jgi:hypothetical protein